MIPPFVLIGLSWLFVLLCALYAWWRERRNTVVLVVFGIICLIGFGVTHGMGP